METIPVMDKSQKQRMFDLKADENGQIIIDLKLGKIHYSITLEELNNLSKQLA